jgi:hypothetical protein
MKDLHMTEIESLRTRLLRRFPEAIAEIDPPATTTGSWFLDVVLQGHTVVIEWSRERGFGLATPSEADYGTGPDEVYPELNDAYSRVVELLVGQLRTSPPTLPLPRIRETQRLSQVELAKRLGINQGGLSRLERRTDMLVGTLSKLIAAMGGELEMYARFPDRLIRISAEDLLESVGTTRNRHPRTT